MIPLLASANDVVDNEADEWNLTTGEIPGSGMIIQYMHSMVTQFFFPT